MPDDSMIFGRSAIRIDGRAKVTGAALYPSDEAVANPAHAFLVTSSIARGRVAGFDLDDARTVPGVLDILTHENVGDQADPQNPHGEGGETTTMQSDRIQHDGQIIAIVVADTWEAAREAAHLVRPRYEAETPTASFDSPGAETEHREQTMHHDYDVGDVAGAFAGAEVRIDTRYGTPTQHHNPIELFTTTCAWHDDHLTIHEPSQFVYGLKNGVAKQLHMEPDRIRVVSRFVGGAFGSKGNPTSRTAWIAIAAKRVGRPVKLTATRDQGYTIATYRAETRHHIQLGASSDGKLVSFRHEGWEVSSRPSSYNVSGTETTARMYACPNIQTKVNVVHADRNTPGFMRAPPETPYMFPLECAMDELAVALKMDPVELRRRNDTNTDPVSGKAFSSRSLMRCFDAAAERFGWSGRDPAAGSMRDGDWLIGWGCASASYPANIGPAVVRVSLDPKGKARVQMAAHEIGTGTYTALAITAAEGLGLPIDKISVEIGDTELPEAGLAAGSSHAASICNAVARACGDIRARLAHAAAATNDGVLAGRDPATLVLSDGALCSADGTREDLATALGRLTGSVLEVRSENIPNGMPRDAIGKVFQGQMQISRGHSREDFTTYAFGAQFVEVRIHRRTCEIRVPRVVGAFAAGTIINPVAAHSQYIGGMIWGIGAALHEKTEIDPNAARYVNDNISEYLIPVNADVRSVEAMIIPEEDTQVNPLGIKGIGELGIVGMNAAIANAVYHATGRRIRDLPIRVEHLL